MERSWSVFFFMVWSVLVAEGELHYSCKFSARLEYLMEFQQFLELSTAVKDVGDPNSDCATNRNVQIGTLHSLSIHDALWDRAAGVGGHQTEFSFFIQPPTAYLFQKRHNISACMYVPTWTLGNFYSSFLIKKVEWVLVCRFDGIYRAPDCFQSYGSSFPIDMWLKHLSLVDTVITATSDWVKTGSYCFRN